MGRPMLSLIAAAGHVGKYFTHSLLGTGKHTVTALTRPGSKNVLPEGVKAIAVDYTDESSLVEALKGQQVLIITLNVRAPSDTASKLHRAAAEAGVPWVIPNIYGQDPADETFAQESLYGIQGKGYMKEIESLGVSSYVVLSGGYWYEFSLGGSVNHFGFDLREKKVHLLDNGEAKLTTSTWDQYGRACAALLSLKELPEDADDISPTLSQWRNGTVYIGSFTISQREMFESVKRVTGTTDADWTITSENSHTRWQKAMEDLKGGDRSAYVRIMYTRSFFPDGAGNSEAKYGLANEALGLPKEDLDDRTKEAVRLALSGELNTYG
ncbi:putative oxidoreductase protein [Phaeoacremonium minimum UCRPA7]|uniref:Putative oxidoreductase protein n=1 Tax=Phaeoacremonium minimum (strain UCR-PA7) TaxID=1286976 RepID=R8BEP3_PHAM7|nr:putative oxidoreductase protein [Phaeoacremonium minimum UCRPA7]EON97774.1 putative oxidoreductase protein [Phaeoacremonium minimum UCRPA7]